MHVSASLVSMVMDPSAVTKTSVRWKLRMWSRIILTIPFCWSKITGMCVGVMLTASTTMEVTCAYAGRVSREMATIVAMTSMNAHLNMEGRSPAMPWLRVQTQKAHILANV